MQGIAQKILAAPERYSVETLRRAIETGLLPAYIGIPLIQARMQTQQQMQQSASLEQPSPDQQPTIAEQVMAQGGVDALPTNLPEQYADGGIVAFSGGGVPLFTNPSDRYGLIQRNAMARAERERLEREAYEQATQFNVPTRRQAGVIDRQASVAAARESGVPQGIRGLGLLSMLGIPLGGARSPEMAEAIRREKAGYETSTPDATTSAAPDTGAAPQARPAAPATPRAGITALPAAAAAPAPAAPTLGAPSGPTNRQLAEDAAANMRGVAEMEEQYANQRMQDLRGQLTGKPFEAYKQRLETEALQAGAERADAKNLALVKAGLAMMAGTSRHALTNIGQGAMVGVADWQAAAKDFKIAARERNKELSLIEQAERAEQRGDIKEQMGLLSAARDRRIAQNSALTKMMLDAGVADNQADAARRAAQFSADAATYREQLRIAAQEREGAADRANRVLTAGIGARATVEAAGLRGVNAPVRGQLGEAAYMKMLGEAMDNPAVRNSALALLNQQTGIPLRAAPKPTDPVYPQYTAALNRAARQHVDNLRFTGASAEAPSEVPQTRQGWSATEVTPPR